MRTVFYNGEQIVAYRQDEFPYSTIREYPISSGKKSQYYDLPCTFDIETTNMGDWAFMYIWQACVDGVLCYGRYWSECIEFFNRLKQRFPNATICMYVHNLSFEFQFMRNFMYVGKVFAKAPRKVVTAELNGIEFRCSLALSNMGLEKFLEKTDGVIHKKLVGDLDYSKKRYADTALNDREFLYCIFDVLGLYEAIKSKLSEDTMATIPLTSTGYVRRAYRESCLIDSDHMKAFRNSELDINAYLLCREAARGGVAGSNPMWTNETLDNVHSRDKKSSYPHQMMVKEFPTGKFIEVAGEDLDEYRDFAACLIDVTFYDIELSNWVGIPYISHGRCRAVVAGKFGNGKVYRAKECRMTITEIDYLLIERYYIWSDIKVHTLLVSQKSKLSTAFRTELMNWFLLKETMKGRDNFLYNKSKNMINASFGMMLTDIAMTETEYHANSADPWKPGEIDLEHKVHMYYRNKNSFLSYQHGVWITAWARYELYRGIDVVGDDIVLTDTDSCKYVEDHEEEFNRLNQSIITENEENDIHPWIETENGERKSMLGIWENEGTYKQFRTMGAKKYAYIDDSDKMHITVSGLNPEKGAEYLQAHGGMSAFKPGTQIPEEYSGRKTHRYNDVVKAERITVEGHTIEKGSSVALEDAHYVLGETLEWLETIDDIKEGISY